MKKAFKQTLSVLLAVVIVFTITLPAFAEENSASETQTEQNLSYNSSNALGDTIVNAIEDENAVRDEYDGKGIFNVSLVGLEATVALSAPDDCTVVVSVYEEETMQMVTSGKAAVSSDDMEVVVTLADYELPDFFVVKAFILNSKNEPVCPSFVDLYNTRAYVESMAKTTEDFDSELVINLDESVETNFAVVTDDAVVAQVDDEKNVIISVDDENGIYVIKNADDSITSLNEGDILYYTYGDGINDYILTKVGKIETKEGLTTITASDDYEMSDFFNYIDIDTSNQDIPQTYSLRKGFDDESGSYDDTKTFPISSGSAELKFSGEKWSLSFKVDGSVTFYVKFFYDFNLFSKDYYEFAYWVQVDASAKASFNFKDSFEKKVTLIDTDIAVVPGLNIHFALKFTVKVSGEFNATGTITFEMKNGASRNSYGEQRKIQQKPTITPKLEINGKISISLIPEIETGFRIVKVFFVDLNVPVDFNVTGTLYVPTSSEDKEKHSCAVCVDGKIKATVSLNISVKFGLKRSKAETIISFVAASKTTEFGSFYISGSGSGLKFGWGKCPATYLGSGGSGGSGSGSGGSGSDYEEPNIREWLDIGTCGDDIFYTLYEDGELYIGGSGKMWDFSSDLNSDSLPPWEEYKDAIKTISINGHSISTIGKNAFYGCENLTSITIPESITQIKSSAFEDCNKFKDIYYGGNKADWGRVDGYTLIDDTVNIHYEKEAELLDYFDYTISNGEVSIDNCSPTISGDIILPARIESYPVTAIGKSAFEHCCDLQSITISNSIITIGDSAFKDCLYLEKITIGNNVEFIGDNAFYDCDAVEKIIIPDSVKTIGNRAFCGCFRLESIVIPDSVMKIGDYVFADCDYLATVTIGSGVTTIGNRAFGNCQDLESIIVDENNVNFSSDEYGVLFNKDKTELIQYPIGNNRQEYTVPSSVITVGDYAFYECFSLYRIMIPESVTSIGSVAFSGCENLESINVNEDNENYSSDEWGVLFNKDKTELIQFPPICCFITDYTIPESVITIGDFAFYRCYYLSNITIPSGVTTIDNGAFAECFSLESITISDSVTKIGLLAFTGCFNLTVYYTGTRAQLSQISGYSEIQRFNIICSDTTALMSFAPDNKLSVYSVSNMQTETIIDAVIGNDYIMVAVRDENAEDLLAPENLLYIDQKTAESEDLTFEYVIDESITDYDVLVFGQKLPHYHLYDGMVTTPPTCTETGIKTFACECGDSYTEEIDMLDHEHSSIVTAPTCTAQGYTTYTCSCGDTYVSDYVDANGHTDEVVAGREATCTETGLTNGVKCSVCGTVTTEQQIVPVINHDDSDKNGACDFCEFDFTKDCSCNCHSTNGFVRFFWKLINFLQKLFGIKSAQYCDCGVAHW